MSNRYYSSTSFLCGAATSLVLVYIYNRMHVRLLIARRPRQEQRRSGEKGEVIDRPDLDMRLLRKAEAVIQGRTDRLLIVVERCTNDHNYSAILRTAEALGIQHCWIIDPPIVELAETGVVKTNSGKSVEVSTAEAEERAKHRLFAKNAQEWLTVRMFSSTPDCLEALRKDGYTIWVTDLSQEAESLSDVSSPLPKKIAIVMGTEAVGCSQVMLDGADRRVYLPMVGFAALVVQTILLQYPQYASSMDGRDRQVLRKSWFPKLAKQRLLTPRQKRDRKVLQRDIERGQATAARQEAGVILDPRQQASVDRLPSLISKMNEWNAALDKEAQAVAAPFVAAPPAPLSDLRRADLHRITYVGKNTKKRHAEHWKDMAAVANGPVLHDSATKTFRAQIANSKHTN